MDELQLLRRQLLEHKRLLEEERIRRQAAESRVMEQNSAMEKMQQALLSLEQPSAQVVQKNSEYQAQLSEYGSTQSTSERKHDEQEESLTAVGESKSVKFSIQGSNDCVVRIFSASIWNNAVQPRTFQKQIDEGVQLLLKNIHLNHYTLDNEIGFGRKENCVVGGKKSSKVEAALSRAI